MPLMAVNSQSRKSIVTRCCLSPHCGIRKLILTLVLIAVCGIGIQVHAQNDKNSAPLDGDSTEPRPSSDQIVVYVITMVMGAQNLRPLEDMWFGSRLNGQLGKGLEVEYEEQNLNKTMKNKRYQKPFYDFVTVRWYVNSNMFEGYLRITKQDPGHKSNKMLKEVRFDDLDVRRRDLLNAVIAAVLDHHHRAHRGRR